MSTATGAGAALELVAGDPAQLATDVGPVIDREAFDGIQKHMKRLDFESKRLQVHVHRAYIAI